MKKEIVITAIVVAVVAFYGGMQYSVKKTTSQIEQGRAGGNFGGGQRAGGGQGGGQRGAGMQGGTGANGGAGDFASGEIIAKDDTSATIKTRDGGSKIIFFGEKTLIDKSVTGATSDLSVGQQVTVNGKTSTDGSITAQNIQIRPIQSNIAK